MAQFREPVIEDVEDADYRAFFDSSVFRVWHLNEKPRTYKILQVKRLDSEFKGKERKQPLLYMADRDGVIPLPFALNKTNAKTIAGLYGNNPHKWVGRFITLFPTTTDVGGRTEPCIRIKNIDPTSRREQSKAARTNKQGVSVIKPDEAPEREPGDDNEESALLPGDAEEPPFGALETDHVIQ